MRTSSIFDAYFVAHSMEQAVIHQAETWYQQRLHREAQGHLIIGLDEKPVQQGSCLWVDLVTSGEPRCRISVAVDSFSGLVRELPQPILCKKCAAE